jgi:hypothetical protein
MKIIQCTKTYLEKNFTYKDIQMNRLKASGNLIKLTYIGLVFGLDGYYGINLQYKNLPMI